MKKIAFLLCLGTVLFSSCSDTIQLDIDNPHNKESQVTLDGELILLPAKSTIIKEVSRGAHIVQLANDSVFSYNFDKDQYLVNPTQTDYILEKIYFSKSGNPTLQAIFNKTNRKRVTFLGYEIVGNYEVMNELVKERDWDFKQRELVPEVISVENKKFSSSKNITKLYAADEFLQYLKDKKEKKK